MPVPELDSTIKGNRFTSWQGQGFHQAYQLVHQVCHRLTYLEGRGPQDFCQTSHEVGGCSVWVFEYHGETEDAFDQWCNVCEARFSA